MSLGKLFESLDEKVFTAEMKESMKTEFNEAVELKASVLADEHIEYLNEKSEEHIEYLNEKAEEYVKIREQEILESLDKYLDRVVEEFMETAQDSLDESVKSEKADMIIEAFESMLVATGVEVSKIVEAKEQSGEAGLEKELQESKEKYNRVVNENITLQEENEKLIKMGLIAELSEGLSIVQAAKFKRLADIVEFTRDESFVTKLETIKESVKGAVEAAPTQINESSDQNKPVWAHLV